MSAALLFLAMIGSTAPVKPTAELLTVENLDCVSRKIAPGRAQVYFTMARKGNEKEAFQSAQSVVKACQNEHGWSDDQTRSAFRVSIMDGWLLQDRLIEKIEYLGDFKPFLDEYYIENVSSTGRHILEDVFLSGKMDADLTAAGYPENKEARELAYNYWEWRGALWDIEINFRDGSSR